MKKLTLKLISGVFFSNLKVLYSKFIHKVSHLDHIGSSGPRMLNFGTNTPPAQYKMIAT